METLPLSFLLTSIFFALSIVIVFDPAIVFYLDFDFFFVLVYDLSTSIDFVFFLFYAFDPDHVTLTSNDAIPLSRIDKIYFSVQ